MSNPGPLSIIIRSIIITLICIACRNTTKTPAAQHAVNRPAIDSLIARTESYKLINQDSLQILADSLLLIANREKDTVLQAKAKYFLAHRWWMAGEHNRAMGYAVDALHIVEKRRLYAQIAALYAIIGNLHKEKANYAMAFDAGDKGLAAAKIVGDTSKIIYHMRLKAMFMQGYGALFQNEKIRDTSLFLHLEGLKLAESNPAWERDRIPFYNNISQFYITRHDYDKGLQYGELAITLARKYKQHRSLTYAYDWVGSAWYYKGQQQKGIDYLQQAIALTKQLKTPFREMEIYESLYECYSSTGNYKEALDCYKRMSTMHDSLKVYDNVKQIGQLEVEYQTRKKDEAIRSLNSVNAARKNMITWMVISLIIFASLSVVLFALYRTIRVKNNAIEESHRQIQEQNDKMELLMKELHHRVKNNLQIVTNLLLLQSNRMTDEESKQAIKMGQQRIEAMALIHRSLYEQSNPKLINMQEYIAELIKSIQQAFGVDMERVHVHLDVNVSELDVDAALPLGLMINEWVTNSFKHAFKQVAEPELQLLLHRHQDGLLLKIKDNGPGLRDELWQQPQRSFGLKLVKVLAKQLHAVTAVTNHQGTLFTVQIPSDKLNHKQSYST